MTDEVGVNRCLEYINIYLTHNDNSVKNLRRFLDGWHAYSKGGSLLTRGGNVRLLNNPDCSKPIVRKCLEDMDFISVDARNVLNGKAEHRLIVEHAIPIKVIRKKLKTMSSPTLLEIQECLKKHYRIGLMGTGRPFGPRRYDSVFYLKLSSHILFSRSSRLTHNPVIPTQREALTEPMPCHFA